MASPYLAHAYFGFSVRMSFRAAMRSICRTSPAKEITTSCRVIGGCELQLASLFPSDYNGEFRQTFEARETELACPYFMPVAKLENGTWPHPSRLPLGCGCTGPNSSPHLCLRARSPARRTRRFGI